MTITAQAPAAVEREHGLVLLRQMLLIRRFEERCVEFYSLGKIQGFLHLYIGQEAVAVGAMQALRPEDNIVSNYRDHGHALARGIPPGVAMSELFGKANGCSRGRGGSMHLFDIGRRFYGGYAVVGAGIPIAVGLALADKLQGRAGITACFFGDGAVVEGEFHESMNMAALWKLPVLFLCENNLYAMGTALERYMAQPDIAARAPAYGIPGSKVDGMDVVAVEEATRRAAEAVRSGAGPVLLELMTYRFRAHSMYDAELYRSKAEVAQWKTRDPVTAFTRKLQDAGFLTDAGRAALEQEVEATVTAAGAEAEAGPLEPVADLLKDVETPLP